MDFTLMTINVNSGSRVKKFKIEKPAKKRREEFLTAIGDTNPDVIAVQEVTAQLDVKEMNKKNEYDFHGKPEQGTHAVVLSRKSMFKSESVQLTLRDIDKGEPYDDQKNYTEIRARTDIVKLTKKTMIEIYDDNAGYGTDYDDDNVGYGTDYDDDNTGYGTDYDDDNDGYGTDYDDDNAGYSTDYDDDNEDSDNDDNEELYVISWHGKNNNINTLNAKKLLEALLVILKGKVGATPFVLSGDFNLSYKHAEDIVKRHGLTISYDKNNKIDFFISSGVTLSNLGVYEYPVDVTEKGILDHEPVIVTVTKTDTETKNIICSLMSLP